MKVLGKAWPKRMAEVSPEGNSGRYTKMQWKVNGNMWQRVWRRGMVTMAVERGWQIQNNLLA
jgi:hypothetical protein